MREKLMITILLLFSLHVVNGVHASESQTSEVSIVALRNDSLDTNEDGRLDAIRVVVVLNTTAGHADLRLVLEGTSLGRTVEESAIISFDHQTEASLQIDAWADDDLSIALVVYGDEGQEIIRRTIGTFSTSPALSPPKLELSLEAPLWLETGDECQIKRSFIDQTGPRYQQSGTRSFTGAPFSVLDDENSLDCSNWPAGEYRLRETYLNGLGQSATSVLNLTIHNRPPPVFNLVVQGDGDEVGTPCKITMEPSQYGVDYTPFSKQWDLTPKRLSGNTSSLDCSDWQPGVHRIRLTVTDLEGISDTEGVNLVRMPTIDTVSNEDGGPIRSSGEETNVEVTGWYTMLGLTFLTALAVFFVLRRKSSAVAEFEPLEVLPDSEGLPTHTDADGLLWRMHHDGQLDWWDSISRTWQRW